MAEGEISGGGNESSFLTPGLFPEYDIATSNGFSHIDALASTLPLYKGSDQYKEDIKYSAMNISQVINLSPEELTLYNAATARLQVYNNNIVAANVDSRSLGINDTVNGKTPEAGTTLSKTREKIMAQAFGEIVNRTIYNLPPDSRAAMPSQITKPGDYYVQDEFKIDRLYDAQGRMYLVDVERHAEFKSAFDRETAKLVAEVSSNAGIVPRTLSAGTDGSDMQSTYLSKAPEYIPSIYNGKVYNIYVPWSGNDINSGGWQTVGDPFNATFGDFSWSMFASGLAASDPKVTPIMGSADQNIPSPSAQGVGTMSKWSLALAVGDSVARNLQNVPIQVITQEKDGQSRIIIQVGLNSKYFQDNAGKTVMPPTGNEGAWNVLTDNQTFRLTLDARHAQDPYTAFISINENGQFVLTPKVYSGDKFEVGHSGFRGASDFQEIPMSPTIISKDGPYKRLAEKLEELYFRK